MLHLIHIIIVFHVYFLTENLLSEPEKVKGNSYIISAMIVVHQAKSHQVGLYLLEVV